ncbi:unnamed protein product, partial [Arabidopsis halleri]
AIWFDFLRRLRQTATIEGRIECLEHAMRRGALIVAEYLGGAVNCDAHHMTFQAS